MYAIPNSSAMDAAAACGGPSATVLPWIVSAEPQSVLQYAADLTQRVARLITIVERIEESKRALRHAWSSGSASDGAIQKITSTIEAFQRIASAVQALETQIKAVSTALQLVQQAYRAVVGAVNPTVATLLSNPYTRAAATSLATSTTASLSSFVHTSRTVLDQIGLVRLIAIVSALATIAGELDKLFKDDSPPGAVTSSGLSGYGAAGWGRFAPTGSTA
jgi:hypothetical protein